MRLCFLFCLGANDGEQLHGAFRGLGPADDIAAVQREQAQLTASFSGARGAFSGFDGGGFVSQLPRGPSWRSQPPVKRLIHRTNVDKFSF